MVYTMTPAGVINTYYNQRITLKDFMDEQVRKVSKLYNAGNAGNMQSFWRGFESATNAGLMLATATQDIVITGQSTTIANGDFSKVSDVLLLGFTRVHPDYANVTLVATFGIPAPVDAIVSIPGDPLGVGKPVMTRGIDFASAADINEMLGAMVDFLEDAITYKKQDNTLVPGGWTFQMDRSSLYSNSRIIDGIART